MFCPQVLTNALGAAVPATGRFGYGQKLPKHLTKLETQVGTISLQQMQVWAQML